MASKLKLTELLYPTSTTPAITINADDTVTFGAPTTTITNLSATNLAYTGTLTGGTGVVNIGSGQVYKDASGNVGIGTASPNQRLQVVGSNSTGFAGATLQNSNGNVGLAGVQFSSDPTYSKAAIAQVRENPNGAGPLVFYVDSATDAADWSAGDEKMRISAAGNVGIGTASPATTLQVTGDITQTWAASMDRFVGSKFSTSYELGLHFIESSRETRIVSKAADSTGLISFYTGVTPTEKMRIDTSGNLLVGTTSAYDGSAKIQVEMSGQGTGITTKAGSSSASYAIGFYNPNGVVGGIITNASATAYNTSSDYRLKENVAPMTGALQTVAALKPVTYTWKADGSAGQGFIAHELQAVVPDCVTGEKDAIDKDGKPQYQGVDTSFLVATLVAAIQELKAEIDLLKGN